MISVGHSRCTWPAKCYAKQAGVSGMKQCVDDTNITVP